MTGYTENEPVFLVNLAEEMCLLSSQLVHNSLYHRLQEQLMKL